MEGHSYLVFVEMFMGEIDTNCLGWHKMPIYVMGSEPRQTE